MRVNLPLCNRGCPSLYIDSFSVFPLQHCRGIETVISIFHQEFGAKWTGGLLF
jgi:hypothetical protein